MSTKGWTLGPTRFIATQKIVDARLNLFLLLTALFSALVEIGRPVARVEAAVEASRAVAVAQAIVPAAARTVAARPEGYVAPMPLRLDLALARRVIRPVAPERRRE